MTPDRHQQIKRLFFEAVELPPPDVGPFLDSACAGDPVLRQEVESLLAHHRHETLLPDRSGPTTSLWNETLGPGRLPAAEPPTLAAAHTAAHPPGTLCAGRYRLVAPLGAGGMGVVYRAEDLELGETIALKFLHPRLQALDAAVEMLRREVRIARQIAHPNVVRVFDLETSGGEIFISMEFVSGENLQSLVWRIGRLTPDKLRQVGRELAAGLAAAHDVGTLHRDLKPANVMLDGNGEVRILDFGIAAALDGAAGPTAAGTPGFVAPELLDGQPPTRQSDLFGWGLVMYYAAAGEPPRQGPNGQTLLDDAPVLAAIDPRLADCIRACLAADPQQRPASAHNLVAVLTAGDPLRATVAAGRIPAPDLLMAAPSWQPAAWVGDALFAAGLGALVLVALLADRALFLSRCGLRKSPDVLQEIAERTLRRLDVPPRRPTLVGVTLDPACLQFVRGQPDLADAWGQIRSGQIPAVFFWYRQGDPRLPRPAPLGEPQWERLAEPTPGTATIRLDGRGALLSLQVADVGTNERRTAASWDELFESAQLDRAEFREVSPPRAPPLFADEVRAWEGPFAPDPRFRVQVLAAAVGGRPVFFDVDQPWEYSGAGVAALAYGGQKTTFVSLRTALWLVALAVAATLAWHNVRRGVVDGVAAWRVVLCVFTLEAIHWLLGSRHTTVLAEELAVGYLWLNVIVFSGVAAGVAFLGVEPFARRRWTWSIITTRRLLAGRWHDRGIWADALLGLVVGLAAVVFREASTLATNLLDLPTSGLNDFNLGQDLMEFLGLRYKAALLITALLAAVTQALLLLALVVGLQRLLRSTAAAGAALVAGMALLEVVGRGIVSPLDCLVRIVLWAIAAWMLLRHSLLATVAALATYYAVTHAPITLDPTNWFAPTGWFVLALVAAALVVCWRRARRPATA